MRAKALRELSINNIGRNRQSITKITRIQGIMVDIQKKNHGLKNLLYTIMLIKLWQK